MTDAATLDARFHALADPTRRAIIAQVWSAPKPAGEIAKSFAISRPAISRHLRVLRESGLVTAREAGTQRLYLADQRALADLRAHFESFWAQGLPRLKSVLEDQTRGPKQ